MKILIKTLIDYSAYGISIILAKTFLAKAGIDIPTGGNVISWIILFNLLYLINMLSGKEK